MVRGAALQCKRLYLCGCSLCTKERASDSLETCTQGNLSISANGRPSGPLLGDTKAISRTHARVKSIRRPLALIY